MSIDWSSYLSSDNTVFGKASRLEKDSQRISEFVKNKSTIAWDGQHYLVFVHINWLFWWFFRKITKKYQDTKVVKFYKYNKKFFK